MVEKFGNYLKRLRGRKTQRLVADAVGTEQSYISQIETGAKVPMPEIAERLDRYYHCQGELVRRAAIARRRRGGPRLRRPAQLPVSTSRLLGRDELLTRLDTAADERPMVILEGGPGVGKTALAAYWARRNEDRWPDGMLHLSLHGHTPGRGPAHAEDLLEDLLTDLGDLAVPDNLGARSRRLRSLLSHKNLLLLLDDADSAEQVRDLLPGPECTVVVTTRPRLQGLAVGQDAYRIFVPPLPEAATVSLLERELGDRARSDPAALTRIARACAGLPLAAACAVEYLRDRPDAGLDVLAGDLTGPDRLENLHTLALGDSTASLRETFAASYVRLYQADVLAAELLRKIGEHDRDTVTAGDAAELLSVPLEWVTKPLTVLVGHNLLTRVLDGYHCHSLLRAFAADIDDIAVEQATLVGTCSSVASRQAS